MSARTHLLARVDCAELRARACLTKGILTGRSSNSYSALIDRIKDVLLVADSSSFSRAAPARIAHLSEIDIFIADRLPSPAVLDICQRCEVEVVRAVGRSRPTQEARVISAVSRSFFRL